MIPCPGSGGWTLTSSCVLWALAISVMILEVFCNQFCFILLAPSFFPLTIILYHARSDENPGTFLPELKLEDLSLSWLILDVPQPHDTTPCDVTLSNSQSVMQRAPAFKLERCLVHEYLLRVSHNPKILSKSWTRNRCSMKLPQINF